MTPDNLPTDGPATYPVTINGGTPTGDMRHIEGPAGPAERYTLVLTVIVDADDRAHAERIMLARLGGNDPNSYARYTITWGPRR